MYSSASLSPNDPIEEDDADNWLDKTMSFAIILMNTQPYWASRLNMPYCLTQSSSHFQSNPFHIGQKPTYCVQPSLRMRKPRINIHQKYPILKQPSMWMTALILSGQSYSTHSHLLTSWNLVCRAHPICFQVLLDEWKAHALGHPRSSLSGHTCKDSRQMVIQCSGRNTLCLVTR